MKCPESPTPPDNGNPSSAPNEDWILSLYWDLRKLAGLLMRGERRDHTLQATALVHEAWIRVMKPKNDSALERRRAIREAMRYMRCVLTDHARAKNRLKRGGKLVRNPQFDLDSILMPDDALDVSDVMTLEQIIPKLESAYSRQAEVWQLRVLAGFDASDIACHLNLSESVIRNDLAFAQAWIEREVNRDVSAF